MNYRNRSSRTADLSTKNCIRTKSWRMFFLLIESTRSKRSKRGGQRVAKQAPRSSFNSPQREWTGSRFTPSFYASSWSPRSPFSLRLPRPGYIMILSRGRRPTDLTIDRASPFPPLFCGTFSLPCAAPLALLPPPPAHSPSTPIGLRQANDGALHATRSQWRRRSILNICYVGRF